MSEDLEGKILLAMLRKNISKSQLAKQIGISGPYLTDILKGRRDGPKAQERIEEIKTFLGVD